MNAKEATFRMLDRILLYLKTHAFFEFDGKFLQIQARAYSPDLHYPSTYLRYMREYRQTHDCTITCINKPKSLYRMER